MNERLYRSRDDRIIAGVAGGLAEQFGIDPSLIRILWAILIIPTGGLALLLYVIMALVVPEEPAGDARWAQWDRAASGYQWPDAAAGTTSSADAASPAEPGPASMADSTAAAGAPPSPIAPTSPIAPDPATPPTPPDQWAAARMGRAEAREMRRQVRQERREWRREHRDPMGALIFGLILVLVGGYFLVRTYVPGIDIGDAWPVLLVIVGIALLVGSLRRSSGTPG